MRTSQNTLETISTIGIDVGKNTQPCRLRLSVNPPPDIFHSNAAHIWCIKNDDPRFERNPLSRVQRSRMAALRNYLAIQAKEKVCPVTLHHEPLGGSGFAWHGDVPLIAAAR
jgi:hypothetical protein